MTEIKKRLGSEKGASITFALLLFLVCAVLSSVILVSATTASGRMAGIAESDQRYYSVTSASEWLKDIIDGKSASVVKVPGKDGDGNATTNTYVFKKPAYEVDEALINKTTPVDPSHPSFEKITEAAAYKYSQTSWGSLTKVKLGTYTLKSTLDKVNNVDPLEVTVEAEIEKDGSIVFYVESIPDKNKGNRFKQRILFSGTVTDPDHTSMTADEDKKDIEAVTLTWVLTSVTTI